MNENEHKCSRCGRAIPQGDECIVDTPDEFALVFCSKVCIKEWIEDGLVSDPELAEDGRAVPVGRHPSTGVTLYRLEPPTTET